MHDVFETYRSIRENTVTVIIGENGTGKSSLLAKISKIAASRSMTIPIATSIYDKFSSRSSRNYRPLRAGSGTRIANQAITNSLKHIQSLNGNDSISRLRLLGKILTYIKYDPRIGIKITTNSETHRYRDPSHRETYSLLDYEYDTAIYAFEKWKSHADTSGVAWIDVDRLSHDSIEITPIIQLASHLEILRKENIIKGIEFYLSKEHTQIPLLHASSGELTFVITMLHIGSHIEPNTTIIVDEPESSLHPKWQRYYISNLLDLFHWHEPTIIIATHSPLIVASKELANSNFKLLRSTKYGLKNIQPKHVGIESLLWEDFDVLTPKSYYLSTCIREIIHETLNHEINKENATKLLKRFRGSAYDKIQINMIDNYIDFIESI